MGKSCSGKTIDKANDPGEGIAINNSYEQIIKTQNKKMIAFVAKQGQMLKKFRNTEYFIKNIGLRRLSIYFKI